MEIWPQMPVGVLNRSLGGERLNGIQEVSGSIPLISTKRKNLETTRFQGFLFCFRGGPYPAVF